MKKSHYFKRFSSLRESFENSFVLLIDLNPFNINKNKSFIFAEFFKLNINKSKLRSLKSRAFFKRNQNFRCKWKHHIWKMEGCIIIVPFNLLVSICVNEIPKWIHRNTSYFKLLFFQDVGLFPNSNQSLQNMFYHFGSKTNRLKKLIFIN